jgi:SAM-dependent methyltransferase
VRTPGTDRSNTLDKILPADLSGKSVLDIGCRYGFFSFEAARRGARRVLGVDFDQEALTKARKVAAINKLDVEFREADVSRNDLTEAFDYVLCLNVLHHLRDPIGVLNHLIDITNERLILEVAGLWGNDRRKIFQKNSPATWLIHPLPLAQPVLDRLPLIMLGADKRSFEANFFFSRAAIESLLMHRNRLFWRAEIFSSPFKGRFICIAEKLRFDELLVVAGPSCSGKRSYIGRLQHNELPEIDAFASDQPGKPWVMGTPNHLSELPAAHLEKFVYHYDIMRPYLRGPFNYTRDRATDLFALGKRTSVLTLISDPAELSRRWQERELARKTYLGVFVGSGAKRKRRMIKVLADREKIRGVYDLWFDFLTTKPGKHVILDLRDTAARIVPVEAWREIRETL